MKQTGTMFVKSIQNQLAASNRCTKTAEDIQALRPKEYIIILVKFSFINILLRLRLLQTKDILKSNESLDI